jgi:hypothetical protein
MIVGHEYLGLFGHLAKAHIKQIGIVDVNITGSGNYVGGLVGGNGDFYGSGIITQCYSSGTITGLGNVGGLVGYNYDGSVVNCYSMCSVYGESLGSPYLGGCGGLVGWNVGQVINCFSIGTVNGGGLIGNNAKGSWGGIEYGIVVDSFWDIDTSDQLSSAGGDGKTTNQMFSQNTYIGWEECDGEFTWKIDEGKDYPRLSWEKKTGKAITAAPLSKFMLGQGTVEDPYLVQTAEDLSIIGTSCCYWNNHFKLMADIDLSGFRTNQYNIIGYSRRFTVSEIELGDWHKRYHYHTKPFTGVFDGNSRTISNFNYTSAGIDSLGLFGYVDGPDAEIKNLGLIDPNINSSTGNYIGSLVGIMRNGTITNCYVEGGSIMGNESVGGLIGRNADFFQVENMSVFGGLIKNCYVEQVSVIGDSSVGGLIGFNSGVVSTSYSTVTVTGNEDVGGLVGLNMGKLSHSCSTGGITGNRYVGGLVGYNNLYVGESKNHWWGGSNYSLKIVDCYSTATVNGEIFVGGLAGGNLNGSLILDSFSTGSVSGDSVFGGLVGWNLESAAIKCLWDVETSGLSAMCGSLTRGAGCDSTFGKTTTEMQTATTFLEAGWDFVDEIDNGADDIWWINEGQDYPRLWWELILEN